MRSVGLGLAVVLCGGAALHAGQLQWISRDEGLPSSQVHSIVQGGDQTLWLATPAGLARYDGVRVRTLARNDGLTTQGLRALAWSPEEVLWVGSDRGVDLLAAGVAPQPLLEDWLWGFVESIVFDDNGTAWIGTSTGLLKSSDGVSVERLNDTLTEERLISDLDVGPSGLWIVVGGILVHRDLAGTMSEVASPELAGVAPLRSVVAHRGGVIVGGDRGLVEVDREGRSTVVSQEPREGTAGALLATKDELWAGIGGQLRRFTLRDGRWSLEEIVLASAMVNDIFSDQQGNVWVATDSSGAARVSSLRDQLGIAKTPCSTQVYSVAEFQTGYLIGGAACSWTTDMALNPVYTIEALDNVKVWDLVESRGGELWAATQQGLRKGAMEGPIPTQDFGLDVLRSAGRILLELDDGILVGTVAGLAKVSNGRATEVLDEDRASMGYVYTLEHDTSSSVADGARSVWVGTIGRGIFRWDPSSGIRRPFETPSESATPRVMVESGLTQGNVYAIATHDSGSMALLQDDKVWLWRDGRMQAIERATDSPLAGWAATFETGDVLWVGGNNGLVRYDLKSGDSQRFVESMGLAGSEFTASRSLLRTTDGSLVQGTTKGLSWLRPDMVGQELTPPFAQLAAAEWTDANLKQARRIRSVVDGDWAVEIAVAAPWFIDARSLEMRHRLQGFERDWSAPETLERGLRYTSLPVGDYTVLVQVRSPLTGWGEPRDLLEFRVLPKWWNTLLARSVAVALLALLAWMLWRLRVGTLVQNARALEEKVRARTTELERLAAHDPLTDLPNRRTFVDSANRMIARASRSDEHLTLVAIDLDNFKRLNDHFGHQAGDSALVAVAQALSRSARNEDLLARYGGDEMVLLCARADLSDGVKAAERMLAAIAEIPEIRRAHEHARVSASFGVAAWESEMHLETLFRRADLALYNAKQLRTPIAIWRTELDSQPIKVPAD